MKKTIKEYSKKHGLHTSVRISSLCLLVVAVYLLTLDYSFAGNSYGGLIFLAIAPNPLTVSSDGFNVADTPTGGTMCAIVGMMNSGIAQAICVLVVIFLGLSALFGQIKWTQAVLVGVGIALLFGASSLIWSLSTNSNTADTTIVVGGIDAQFSGGKVQSCN